MQHKEQAMNRFEKTSNDLTALAPKWSERGHLLAALPKHLADAQEAIKSQQNIDKEMTDLSLIASAWLKSQQQKELLETRLKRFKETAGYPSMASVLASPAVVGNTNKEHAMNNLNKAASFGAMMGKMAGGYEPGSNARFSLPWGEEHMKDFEDAIMDHVKQLNREDALRAPRNPKYDIQEKDLEDYDKIINWLPANTQAHHREKLNLLKTPSRAGSFSPKSASFRAMMGKLAAAPGIGDPGQGGSQLYGVPGIDDAISNQRFNLKANSPAEDARMRNSNGDARSELFGLRPPAGFTNRGGGSYSYSHDKNPKDQFNRDGSTKWRSQGGKDSVPASPWRSKPVSWKEDEMANSKHYTEMANMNRANPPKDPNGVPAQRISISNEQNSNAAQVLPYLAGKKFK